MSYQQILSYQSPNTAKPTYLTLLIQQQRSTKTRVPTVRVAPNGVITYVSDLYGSSQSDKEIVRDCGLFNYLVVVILCEMPKAIKCCCISQVCKISRYSINDMTTLFKSMSSMTSNQCCHFYHHLDDCSNPLCNNRTGPPTALQSTLTLSQPISHTAVLRFQHCLYHQQTLQLCYSSWISHIFLKTFPAQFFYLSSPD